MKKLLSILLLCVLCMGVCSCTAGSKKEKTVSNGATEDEANYPTAAEDNFIKSKNTTGMRYNMNLWQYTTDFNKMYTALGGETEGFSYSKWTLMKSGEKDDNGVSYDYYYLDNDDVVLTATVETKSKQIMNLGCGTTVSSFIKSENNQQKIMTLCGIMAVVSGGYESDDVPFFGNLYVDAISGDDHCFWYNNCIYIFSSDDGDGEGEGTMLFRTMPAQSDIETRWNLQDYKAYWLG